MTEKKIEVEKPTKQVQVRVLNVTGKSVLIEWQDKKGLHRATIPADKAAEKIDLELLEAAPAYGVPWADLPIKAPSGDDLQAAMYAAGFWTDKDLSANPQKAIGVLQSLFTLHLGSLVEFAAKHKLSEVH